MSKRIIQRMIQRVRGREEAASRPYQDSAAYRLQAKLGSAGDAGADHRL